MRRLTNVAVKIVSESQTAFISGRNIMEGTIILQEMLHELHRKRLNGVTLKLDFEKTCDKVNWGFLQKKL
jgi:hypothetical protein